jgi:hypothetical protein
MAKTKTFKTDQDVAKKASYLKAFHLLDTIAKINPFSSDTNIRGLEFRKA